jgi:hypothetical protein
VPLRERVVVLEHLRIANARHSKTRQTVARRSRADPAELEVDEVADLRDAVLGRELVLFASWGKVQNYAAYDPVGGDLQPFVDLGRVSSRDHRVVLVRSLIQIIEACRWRLAR